MSVIDEYLRKVDPSEKVALERIRQIVKKTLPDVDECIGYGMPVFRYKNKYLLGMCEFKNHMSIFPGSGAVEDLKDHLENYKTSKGTIQFTLQKPLPELLIRKIIKHRAADITK